MLSGLGGVGGFFSAPSGLGSRWRVNVSAKSSGSAFITASEIEMRETVGGSDAANGGTATASLGTAPNEAARAFDNNTGTIWSTGTTAVPQWIEYQFPGTLTIEQIAWKSNAAGDQPTSFTVEYYNGSGWTTYWSVAAGSNMSQLDTSQIIYSRDDPDVAGHSMWRIYINQVQSPGNWPELNEIEWRTSPGGADETAVGHANGGNALASHAVSSVHNLYDNNPGGARWISGAVVPVWVGYRFASQKDIREVWISPHNAVGAPSNFDVQYFNAQTGTWVTSWSVPSTGTWTSAAKTFTKP